MLTSEILSLSPSTLLLASFFSLLRAGNTASFTSSFSPFACSGAVVVLAVAFVAIVALLMLDLERDCIESLPCTKF
jgi:hypothetical protein